MTYWNIIAYPPPLFHWHIEEENLRPDDLFESWKFLPLSIYIGITPFNADESVHFIPYLTKMTHKRFITTNLRLFLKRFKYLHILGKLIVKFFILSVLAWNGDHFVLDKGNNSSIKYRKRDYFMIKLFIPISLFLIVNLQRTCT